MRVYISYLSIIFLLSGHSLSGQSKADRNLNYHRVITDLDTLIQSDPEYALTRFDSLEAYYEDFSGGIKAYFHAQREWNHYRLGNYGQALEDLKMAKSFSEANDNYYLDAIYLQFGHLYEAIDSLDLAVYNYQLALKWSKALGNQSDLVSGYDGLAQVYQDLELIDSARFYFETSLELVSQLDDPIQTAQLKGNYGTFLFDLGEVDKAITFQKEAMELEAATFDSVSLIFSNANLGRYYYQRNQNLSNEYIATAFTIAELLNAKRYLLELYEGFAFIEEEHGNYERALEYFRNFHKFENELVNEEMMDRVKDWQITLDNQQKDEEIKLQKARTRNLMITVVIVIALASWIIYSNIQIRRVKLQLEQQNEELDQLNATKDKFFSIIAHDLRSPMIALQGVGQKLEYFIRKDRQEKLLEMGTKIDQSIDQLNHLLNNLLNWATSQTGGIPNHPERFDIHDIVEENIDLYQSLARIKEITLVNQAEHLKAYADLNTTSTVIRNLLSNAIKFTRQGGQVLIKTEKEDGYSKIMIIDEGPGMGDDTKKSLFTEDIKSISGSGGEKGFGLGLKLCKEFVEMARGSIFVESKEGFGSTFIVRLPSRPAAISRDMEVA